MIREAITTGVDLDAAIEQGCAELGAEREDCSVEVLERVKKGLFGKIKTMAKVRVWIEEPDENEKLLLAKEYLLELLKLLKVENAVLVTEEKENGAVITIEGDNLGAIIGRRGETLDALQYLTSLACNRIRGDFYKITLDCSGYRQKREEALKELANKIARQVLKTGRNSVLEPMNPYERRMIHAVISEIEGVSSKSVGEDPNRKVVVIPNNPKRSGHGSDRRGGGKGRRDGYERREPKADRSAGQAEESKEPAERISDAEYMKKLGDEALYSKIEL